MVTVIEHPQEFAVAINHAHSNSEEYLAVIDGVPVLSELLLILLNHLR